MTVDGTLVVLTCSSESAPALSQLRRYLFLPLLALQLLPGQGTHVTFKLSEYRKTLKLLAQYRKET